MLQKNVPYFSMFKLIFYEMSYSQLIIIILNSIIIIGNNEQTS